MKLFSSRIRSTGSHMIQVLGASKKQRCSFEAEEGMRAVGSSKILATSSRPMST